MPREIVPSGDDSPFHVKVGWHHGVQVGIEGDDGRSLLWLLYGSKLGEIGRVARAAVEDAVLEECSCEHYPCEHTDKYEEFIGRSILNQLDVLSDSGERGYAGIWSDLDRWGCNRLIRLVRKARDGAYGKDE
ncbi:MAG TPA: hypothetical protein VJ742_12465 [Nitrososphaera sp.]|nr:hypothetical protein [Nitrososphaera sp.]